MEEELQDGLDKTTETQTQEETLLRSSVQTDKNVHNSFVQPTKRKGASRRKKRKNTREKPAGHKICICITAVAISLAVAACVWVFLPVRRQHSEWLAIEDTILLLILNIIRSRHIQIQIPLLLPDPSLLSSSSNQPSLLNRLPRLQTRHPLRLAGLVPLTTHLALVTDRIPLLR
ncbi:unnamed protein product [Zymoseptoria tritici ST99CH_3D1]|nr:unnamed protein product [Zymoseptoria tritici ST99CH_3D1]